MGTTAVGPRAPRPGRYRARGRVTARGPVKEKRPAGTSYRITIMRFASLASALAAAASLSFPAAACPPTATLHGPAAETRQLEGLLLEQGVVVSGVACPHRTVAATLGRLPGTRGLWLHIQDGYGRASDRQVADARTAASLIGSWVLGEDADFIAAPAPTSAPSRPPVIAAAPQPEPRQERTRLLGSAEV